MNPNTALILDVAAHLRGAAIKTAVSIPFGHCVLHLWSFETADGREQTLIVQQRERRFVRWKLYPGALADARRHYLRRLEERRSSQAMSRPKRSSASAAV